MGDMQVNGMLPAFRTALWLVALCLAQCNGATVLAGSTMSASDMPLPFTRVLFFSQSEPLNGSDVYILQQLLQRAAVQPAITSTYDAATQRAVIAFQEMYGLPSDGVVGPDTAHTVLDVLSEDGYIDDGSSARSLGYLYKVVIPIHRNRSVESNGTLYDADGTPIYSFRARTHGMSLSGEGPWPDYNSVDPGRNMFTSNGNTLTGLAELDLNAPEDDPRSFGPYPINRVTNGLKGNFAFMYPSLRSGILLHTGEWPGWQAPMQMPNSHGCIHSWPNNIDDIYQLLTKLGVQMRPNTPQVPYPFRSQGLISVYYKDD